LIWKNLKERDHLGDLGVDRRLILKRIFKRGCEDMEWIPLAQGSVQWRVLENIVMNLLVP
jgi:hypothetical protein